MADLSPELLQMGLVLVIALCVGGMIYALAYPLISGERQAAKRIQGATENKTVRTARRAKAEEAQNRRKQVSDTLKSLEDREKARQKVTLRLKLQRAGLDVAPRMYWICSMICGAVCGIAVFAAMPSANVLVPIAALFVGTLGLPPWVLNFLIRRRQNKFIAEFANAIDVIVRGVKSGLPLNECLKIISVESPSPIREEFQELIEHQRVGVPLSECFERMISRLPLSEVKFFGIVIGIQQQAGGNLSEALGNLSGVLRDRRKMQMKVKALSSEAKASAWVLGSLPFIVTTLIYLSAPDYISVLFKTRVGNFILMCAGFWMFIGMMVMRKMVNFKF